MKLMNQKELAERWCVAEATLERWRSIGAGPPYLVAPAKFISSQHPSLT